MTASRTTQTGASVARLELVRKRLRDARGHRPDTTAGPSIQAVGDRPRVTSQAQERMWLLEQMMPGYNSSTVIRVRGELDTDALARGLSMIVARHEVLRTVFEECDGVPVPRVLPARPVSLAVRTPAGGYAAAIEMARELMWEPFDLATGPVFRAAVLRLAGADALFVLVVHHIAIDGSSMSVLWSELSQAYGALVAGHLPALPPLPIQYGDYAAWSRVNQTPDKLRHQLDHWRRHLAGATATELPTDRPRPAVRTGNGARVSFTIDAESGAAIARFSRQHNVTPFMTLLAAFNAVIAGHAATTDVTIGTPIAGRVRPELEGLIGYFVNTLLVRTDLSDDPSFAQLLARTRAGMLAAYEHQELPFEALLDELRPARDASRNPLFQILFAVADEETDNLSLTGLSTERLDVVDGRSRFDLNVALTRHGAAFDGIAYYESDLFDQATVARFVRHFVNFVRAAVAEPDRPVSTVDMIDPAERDRLRSAAVGARVAFPDGLLPDLVDAVAAADGDVVAVTGPDGSLTYRDLVGRANHLAWRLRAAGVDADVPVGVWMDRSVELVVVLLAIMKAGGAFLPFDPDVPAGRVARLLADAGTPVICADSTRTGALRGVSDVPVLDCAPGTLTDAAVRGPETALSADNLISIYYTSGSTGVPKGVASTHGGWVNRIRWMQASYPLRPGEPVLHKTVLSFDDAAVEIAWPLISGATVVMLPPGLHRDPRAIADYAERYNVVALHFVPSMLAQFCEEITPARAARLAALRYVISSGETLRPELVGEFHDRLGSTGAGLFNQWGATEVSIDSTSHPCAAEERALADISLGGPIANNQVHLLDADLNPVPVGVHGDLYLGGVGLARGYLGDPRKTALAFRPSPFGTGERLYRTGDRGVRRAGGALTFLGRADSQVKIRGIRIEPAEIEHVLRQHAAVREAVVTKWEPAPGDQRLAVYVTGPEPDAAVELTAYLGEHLPAYMIPSSITVVGRIPKNANGKTDYRALPAPRVDAVAVVSRPRSAAELLVARIWSDVLGQRDLDVHASFFALGGHSLLATRIVSRLRAALDVAIPVSVIFDNPTIHAMAVAVEPHLGKAGSAILPVSTGDAPLSPSQRRLWILEQLRPDLVEYNLCQVLELSGALSPRALESAIATVIARHSVLRSRIVRDAGTVRMRVEPPSVVALSHTDLRHLPPAEADAEALRISRADADEPFDLTKAPWLRARLTYLPERRFLLTVVVHHIATDGASMRILWSELSRAYAAHAAGQRPDLPAMPCQFRDYAAWSGTHRTAETMAAGLGYWTRRLTGASATELRPDRPRPAERNGHGARLSEVVDPAVAAGIRALARDHNATPFMVLFAAFAAVLSRHTGSRDVLVGTPIEGRTRPETENLIGFFVNTLLLRTDLSGNPSFDTLVDRVRAGTLDAYEHQEVPFDLLVDTLQPERDLSRNPLFQIMFNLVEEQTSELALPGVSVRALPAAVHTARFDLDVTVVTDGNRMSIVFDYATGIFEPATIARFARHYQQVLAQIVARPGTRLADLTVVTAEETRLLRHDWNNTATGMPDRFVDELVDERAARTPDAIALSGPDGTELSYAELAERSTALAAVLRSAGAGQGAPVAVLVQRSPDLIIGLLAVLKSGAAYLPLDPTYPRDRLAYMLADSGADIMLAQPALAAAIGLDAGVRLIDIDSPPVHAAQPPVQRHPDNLAYVIYTSGSTGRPKGVMVPHRGVTNFVLDMTHRLELSETDTFCAVTTVAFDIAVLETYAPLAAGARVLIADRETTADGTRLAALLAASSATVLAATPATYHLLLLAGWAGGPIRIISGGEALTGQLAAELTDRVPALWNLYGPTETTVYSTLRRVTTDDSAGIVPIGEPIANTQVHVVDDAMRLVPIGSVGELVIGGVGVVRGYRNRPALTADRFVPDPFTPGQRLYRTGDLARRRADGTLHYLGRADTQVKLRGYRIELGEIEGVLQRHPAVARAAVIVAGEGMGRQIVGYVSWRDRPDEASLQAFARDQLPQYMVPAGLVTMSELPLTPNGKVDRKLLPEPRSTAAAGAPPVNPRDQLELRVTAICERILGRSPIGIRDDFFAAGGNSLTAFELVEAVRGELGVSVPLSAFFRAPTVEGLCAALPEVSTVAGRLLVPLAAGPSATSLFLVHPHGGGVASFVSLGRELDGILTVHGIEAVGYNTDARPLDTVAAMADRYVGEIDATTADRPRLIGGWSFGGVVAFEMAVRLERAGRPVDAVVLLDAPPPGSKDLRGDGDVVHRLGADAGLAAAEMESLDDDQLIAALVHRAHRAHRLPARVDSAAVRRMVAVARANGVAAARYHTNATIAADLFLLTASETHPTLNNPDIDPAEWRARTTGRVHEVPVPGSHHDMVHQPHAAELAARIADIATAVRRISVEDK